MPVSPICSICCDYYTPDCIIETTKCGHIFHRQCILRWLKNQPKCPECRQFGPVLCRVYLNFNDSTEAEEANSNANSATSSYTQQQIEKLIIKLSLEEDKNKNSEKRIQELERKVREQVRTIKLKDEELQKVLKSTKELNRNVSLEEVKQTRNDVQEIEKLLKKEISASKLRQQKPNSTINLVSRSPNSSTILKLNTSICTCRTNNSRTKTSVSTSTTSSLSYPARRMERTVLPPTTSRRTFINRSTTTENVSFECNFTDLI